MRYPRAMLRRTIAPTLLAPLVASLLVAGATPAAASCAADPDALRLREMIDQDTTGDDGFPVLLLGIVASWHDLGGQPGGGPAIARVAVAEHPVGRAPLVSDVRFRRDAPGVTGSGSFEFKRDGRYAVVARRLADGTFRFDGACGQTRRLNRDRFRALVRYSRTH